MHELTPEVLGAVRRVELSLFVTPSVAAAAAEAMRASPVRRSKLRSAASRAAAAAAREEGGDDDAAAAPSFPLPPPPEPAEGLGGGASPPPAEEGCRGVAGPATAPASMGAFWSGSQGGVVREELKREREVRPRRDERV